MVDIPTEHYEQREFVKWFRQNHKARIFAIANGGMRSKSEALRLVAEGIQKGVPDLFIPAWNVWVEMKRQKGGVVSPEQKDWKAYLESIGHIVFIAYGCEDAKNKIDNYKKLAHIID